MWDRCKGRNLQVLVVVMFDVIPVDDTCSALVDFVHGFCPEEFMCFQGVG